MPLARVVTALQPHLAEQMTTHEFIDVDADLAYQDLSDWEKQFFCRNWEIKRMRIMEMNQTKKMRKKKKKQSKKQKKQ